MMETDGCRCDIRPVQAGPDISGSLEGGILLAAGPFPGLLFISFTSFRGILAACDQMVAELQPEHTGELRNIFKGLKTSD